LEVAQTENRAFYGRLEPYCSHHLYADEEVYNFIDEGIKFNPNFWLPEILSKIRNIELILSRKNNQLNDKGKRQGIQI
jgi:hypothetical protein